MILVSIFLIGQALNAQSVTSGEFEKMILGKWKLTEYKVDGYKRPPFESTEEYRKGEVLETDIQSTSVYHWKFYEEGQVLIRTREEEKGGGLSRYKMLMVTQDSMRYQLVTYNGLTECKYEKVKN